MMKRITSLLLFLIPTVISLDCNGPADIVIAVPGSEVVPRDEFQHLENFLISVVSYYNIAESNTQVGLVLYGREPIVIADLKDAPLKQSLNARITLLSQRTSHISQISGGQNVPKAIEKVQEMLSAGRIGVPKIGVIMTYGSADLSSSDPQIASENIASAAKSALDEGINMFATNTGGGFQAFPNITMDTCRLFSLGSYSGLGTLLPYLASATCYVLDPEVNPTSGNCFPELMPPPAVQPFQCGSLYSLVPDPTNCAYYYKCPQGFRQACETGLLFDPSIKRCNHKEFVTCYSGLSCPAPKGLFPHPTDCQKFLSCSQNIPYVLTCPNFLVFNPSKGYCDFKKNVICDDDSSDDSSLINRIPS